MMSMIVWVWVFGVGSGDGRGISCLLVFLVAFSL